MEMRNVWFYQTRWYRGRITSVLNTVKKQCFNDVFTIAIQLVWHNLSRLRNLLICYVSRKVVGENFVYFNFENYYGKLQFWKLTQEMMHSHTICRCFAMILAMLTCAWTPCFKFVVLFCSYWSIQITDDMINNKTSLLTTTRSRPKVSNFKMRLAFFYSIFQYTDNLLSLLPQKSIIFDLLFIVVWIFFFHVRWPVHLWVQ